MKHGTSFADWRSAGPASARHSAGRVRLRRGLLGLGLALTLGGAATQAQNLPPKVEPKAEAKTEVKAEPAKTGASATAGGKGEPVGSQIIDALQGASGRNQRATLVTGAAGGARIELPPPPPKPAQATPSASRAKAANEPTPVLVRPPGSLPNPRDQAAQRRVPLPESLSLARARAAAMQGHGDSHAKGELHWSYEGEKGPSQWSRLKPEYATCAAGRRQSPVNIESTNTLVGPAEPLKLSYSPSNASVVHNGHTVQVDVSGENTLTVRDTTYRLVQFHFHHPSEERIDQQGFAMVAHLVHRSDDGRLAVLAVLLNPGPPNLLIERVWTYMPLDVNDRVRMPAGLLDLNELMPQDMRYFQFMGSLTTPPCTEGVLWLVLKQPVAIAREQLRVFSQLFPNNARPVQPANGRVIREAR